jgi:hypothetical protein
MDVLSQFKAELAHKHAQISQWEALEGTHGGVLQPLRQLVHAHLNRHAFSSAAFFADKLVSFSQGAPKEGGKQNSLI